MGKNKTRSKSALKQNSVTAENKRLSDDGNINFTFKILSAIGIIIIVSGHCYNGGVSLMYDWFPKYSYNLALFVFISGYFYKEKHDNLNSVAYFAIVLGVQLLLLTFCKNLEYTPSKCVKFDNGCVIPYVTAITGIAFWLRVAKLITPIIKNKKLVRMISDNTYSIMIHHIFAFMIVKWAFRGLSVITPLFKDFDILKLKSTIWYIYRPNGLNFYCIIYLAAGIFIPILIGTVTHRIFEFMKEHTLKSMQKSSRTGKVNKIEKVVK